MKYQNFLRVFLLLACFSRTAFAEDAPAVEKSDTESAVEYHQAGDAYYLQQDYDQACAAYAAAYSLKQHYQTAGNLGDCEMRSGDYRNAAEHLSKFIGEYPASEPRDRLENAKALLAQARTKVGVLRIDSSLTGAQVSMDGRPIGSGPMATELFVEPGRYRVEAKTGSELVQRIVDVQASEERRVQLEPVPKVAVERRHEEPSGKGKVIGAGIAGGLGAMGVVVGGGFLIGALLKEQERSILVHDVFGDAPKGNECTTAQFQTDCNRIGALVDEKYVFQNVAIGGFVVGVAGVATSIALGLSSRRSPAGPKVGTSVMVVPTASGIVVGGKF